jgi:hypothetical protein
VLDGVEVLQELLPVLQGESLPDLLEDELIAVCDDAGEQRRVEGRDAVFWLGRRVRWQKARAACSTLVKVACLSKVNFSGMMKRSPLYSMRIDCSMAPRTASSLLHVDWHSPIILSHPIIHPLLSTPYWL